MSDSDYSTEDLSEHEESECKKCLSITITCKHYDNSCVDCSDPIPHHIYYNCIYCVFEGGDMECEWDSFDEVVGTGRQPFKCGATDGYNGVVVPKYKKCKYPNVLKVYMDGIKMGRLQKKYDDLVATTE